MINLFKEEQPIASRIIQNAVDKKHFAHAYIIETNGYEKGYDFALSFAKLLLCPNHIVNSSNCENCYKCDAIDSGNYPELKIINPDGAWIKKEQLLELIVSRCQIISLNGQAKIGNNMLEKLGLLLSDNENDYNNFINDETLTDKINMIIKFIEYFEKNGTNSIIYTNKNLFEYFPYKENISWAIIIMLYFYKDVLNFKIGANVEIFTDYVEQIKNISENNSILNIINKINKVNECRKNIDLNANLNLAIDRLIIEMEEGVR